MNQPDWVCVDCGHKYGQRITPGRLSTMHMDECDVCGQEKPVTQPRDFGYLRMDWQQMWLREKVKG